MGEEKGGGPDFECGWALRGAVFIALAAATLLASGSEAAAAGKCTGGINERALCLVAKVSDTAVHVAWGALGIAIVFAGIMSFFGKKDMHKLWMAIVGGAVVLALMPFIIDTLREAGDPEIRTCSPGSHDRCILVSEDPFTQWLIPQGVSDRNAFDCYRSSGGSIQGYATCIRSNVASNRRRP